ncbi:hypothetical protein [Mucilaginibacter phyllosphaerae]|uniref:Uncharacterized protein n=1 Tax=Mucilaginibacter phyllosphaerae TaxID=1812349 RepID=A0A4Y8AJM4_9SPHI|nr:hypothetical protein [Mucilaginibacter phyllosphaerae]MBB3967717.1 hypothetical protein [Mucilaginibacter phyllosphaerae]TEW69230.1 hypothetical protein E2R65_03415 [Mucilaginibacter phyllosphaerae]GGH03800.1 hypothetical protein GCM10007352_06620 [Mucilaginibacter phyllosphaerae]
MSSITKFGAINAPKPIWATWLFRSVAILTTVASFWVESTTIITNEIKVEVILALKSVDILVLGFSNLFGVIVTEEQET